MPKESQPQHLHFETIRQPHRTIISSPPSGIDTIRWNLDHDNDYCITGISRLQIPRILFNTYVPYLLLKIWCKQTERLSESASVSQIEKPIIHTIPLFQIPSAISDGMTNWKPDTHTEGNMYITSTSIEFMICTPDGDGISLLSSDHSRFIKNISQSSRFISGYSKQSNPDIVYPISEIDTHSTETFKYSLQSHTVNLFITVEE